ncbi:J domain-containing protein [Haematococcus lacustris]|uniref:J domain-containing protein n=1 Tax=Haematococcus lacustris TaxID=44745 RepID=A0A699YE32_HAELA|nr:J domain-containing protein [Haematococcus lacustris]
MKYVVGPGGVKIQEIQRKSKARVQIIKEEAEMTKAWGSGPTPTFKQQNLEYAAAVRLRQAAEKAARDKAKLLLKAAPGADGQGGVKAIMAKGAAEAAAAGVDGKAKAKAGEAAAGKGKEGKVTASGGQGVDTGKEGGEGMEGEERGSSSGDEDPLPGMPVRKMVTLLLYGNQHAVEAAERMIMEAIDNREQKQKQRARDYEKKREEKARLRQMYHMRHSRLSCFHMH